MSNQRNQNKNFANAINMVRERIKEIGEKLRTAEGDDKAALQKELGELMSSLGMTYDPESPIEDFFAKEGKDPKADGATEADPAASTTGTEETKSSTEDTEGWWYRFKGFCGRNKAWIIGGVVAAVGIGAALYAFLRGRGQGADTASMEMPKPTAGFHGSAEGAAEGDVGAEASFMSKVGEWFVSAGGAIKKGLVAAKDWVVGIFSSSDAGTETAAAEGVPSAA